MFAKHMLIGFKYFPIKVLLMVVSLVNRNIQTDLRDFIREVEQGGELKVVTGAHWDKEIGAVTEVLYREKVDRSPALLFDKVPGYKEGFRCLQMLELEILQNIMIVENMMIPWSLYLLLL